VNVGAKPYVIRQIPSDVVRIFVDHDLIRIPEPVTAEAEVIRGDAEVEPAEPETARTGFRCRSVETEMLRRSGIKTPEKEARFLGTIA